MVFDDIGRTHEDQNPQRSRSVGGVRGSKNTEPDWCGDLDHDHDRGDQVKRQGKGPSDVAMEQLGITRSLRKKRQRQHELDAQHGGRKEVRRREVGGASVGEISTVAMSGMTKATELIDRLST